MLCILLPIAALTAAAPHAELTIGQHCLLDWQQLQMEDTSQCIVLDWFFIIEDAKEELGCSARKAPPILQTATGKVRLQFKGSWGNIITLESCHQRTE